MRRTFAWVALGLGATISGLVAGWHAYAWTQTDTREKVVGFFALVVCVLAIDSLAKARAGIRVATAGPYRARLITAGLLTALAAVLVALQIATSGVGVNFRLMFDVVFLSIGLVLLGQALFTAEPTP